MKIEDNIKIPIIILNWNGIDDTRECVDALLQQTYQNFQIYLVDNNSNPSEKTELKKLYSANSKIELVLNDENLGFAKGNNEILKQIIKRPDYKYAVLLNNDTKADKYWLEELIHSAEVNKADMISSKMLNYQTPEKMDNAGHIMLNTGEVLPLGARDNADDYNQPMQNFGACAGAALYSTEMLKKIGIFDSYFQTGYEDAELGVRAILAGYKSIYEPKAKVLHKGSVSINKVRNFEYSVNLQKNIYYTYLKLLPNWVIILNIPFILIRLVMLITVGLFSLRFRLVKVQLTALVRTWKDRKLIGKKRKKVTRKLNSWQIIQKQKFFLTTYFNYFAEFVLKGRKSVIE